MHIYPWQIAPTPPPIKHRTLENHHTKYVSYIAQCIYTHGRLTPHHGQLIIDALNTATPNLADLLADVTPSIKHRCLEYCYTKLGRSGQIY